MEEDPYAPAIGEGQYDDHHRGRRRSVLIMRTAGVGLVVMAFVVLAVPLYLNLQRSNTEPTTTASIASSIAADAPVSYGSESAPGKGKGSSEGGISSPTATETGKGKGGPYGAVLSEAGKGYGKQGYAAPSAAGKGYYNTAPATSGKGGGYAAPSASGKGYQHTHHHHGSPSPSVSNHNHAPPIATTTAPTSLSHTHNVASPVHHSHSPTSAAPVVISMPATPVRSRMVPVV